MNSAVAETNYQDFIREAFIDPIRSVLIVDDQYPTLEERLDAAQKPDEHIDGTPYPNTVANKNWVSKAKEIREIVDHFRSKKWLIDIHDGKGIDLDSVSELTQHLHQSDLLILDYQLDPGLRSADKCLKVVEHLAQNEHFNLVVIHTEEEIAVAQRNIILSLLEPCPRLNGILHGRKVLDEIENWEYDNETILKDLIASISEDLYLEVRKFGIDHVLRFLTTGNPRVSKFVGLFQDKAEEINLTKNTLFIWLIAKKQKELENKLSQNSCHEKPDWETGENGENWIRTSKLFITVAAKRKNPNSGAIGDTRDLPNILLKALTSWKPVPPRLVLTKLRVEISNSGVAAEDAFLSNKELQAGWYQDLLKSDTEEIKTNTRATIEKYWHGLSEPIAGSVSRFTESITTSDHSKDQQTDEIIADHFRLDKTMLGPDSEFSNQSKLEQNAYNCGTAPSGWHLTTGHIIELKKDDYWVCLSPSCDLVPGQKNGARYKRLNDSLPFKAVKLHPVTSKEALDQANSNLYVFSRIQSEIKAFSFVYIEKTKEGEEAVSSSLTTSTPTWDELFAKNQGRINDSNDFCLEIGQISHCSENGLKPIWNSNAKVVAQLRYEYAINLMQRLGASLTRIGLDFVN